MSRRPGLYALLLKAYPREYCTTHGGELLATLHESSGGRVVPREAVGLLFGALRQRRLADRVRRRRTSLISAAWLTALMLLGMDVVVGSANVVGDLRSGGGLQASSQVLGGLLSAVVLALCLRGRVRGALAVLLLEIVLLSGLAVVSYEPPSIYFIVPAIVLGVMSARQSSAMPTGSWWWLAVPALWGAGVMASTSSQVWLYGATLALVTVLAGCEARFALAAAMVFLVMAVNLVVVSALVLSSNALLPTAAAMVGIALFLALLAGPALTRPLTPASPTA